jgi:hypothetical protein
MKLRRLLISASAALLMVLQMSMVSAAASDVPTVAGGDDDVFVPIGEIQGELDLEASDPLGLLVGLDAIRQHTLGVDNLDVWVCGANTTAQSAVTQLEADIAPYFEFHSRGRYEPRFRPRGNAGGDPNGCAQHARDNASPNAEGALFIMPGAGGFASPGFVCGFVPCPQARYGQGNARHGFLGHSSVFISTAAHEMGHMLHWPHSYTGASSGPFAEYDNALDVMSGNYGVWGDGSLGSFPDPYGTAAINLYAAGWIDPDEVLVVDRGDVSVQLVTGNSDGIRMVVIPAGNRFYVLGPRIRSTYDPFPNAWRGVEVYEVEVCSGSAQQCINDDAKMPGFRRIKPHPAVPFDYSNGNEYQEPLPHVIPPGKSRSIAGITVRVGQIDGNRIAVTIDAPTFSDTRNHVFVDDIEWLANSGITKGCNPPANSRFCPDAPVTRGQMAAFLHRALPDLRASGATDFSDDNGHVFEADIRWLSATGITKGCNPPANTRFCPDQLVTRGQMAAFLRRALPHLRTSGSVEFTDDNGHVFEEDIEWLAAAGITRGCNPPANDRFCPNAPVTRGAMAAFLNRALGG